MADFAKCTTSGLAIQIFYEIAGVTKPIGINLRRLSERRKDIGN